tara:strand:- start:297 stop:1439 length:1143 start_codon:yes stop_codon:yes gene_type:complete
MLIYNLETIQSISNTITVFEIDINKFLKDYIQIEKNDKYEPIFSLTDKYKSFPINSSRSTKNFFQNNKWKINNSNVLKINQDLKLSLNKLSSSNYNAIRNDIITILKNNNTIDVLNIFMKELFEKIWFDEKFLESYVSLCYDLWNHKDINCNSDFILQYCKQEFENRNNYKIQLSKTTNDEQIFISKRKIVGTIEFIGQLYIKEYLDNEILQDIIDSLLTSDMSDLDYESFYKLWIIIDDNNRLEEDIIIKYKEIITQNISDIDNNRIKILLKTLVEQMVFQKDDNNINYINTCIIEFKKTKDLCKIVKEFKNLEIDLVINELIMNELENKTSLFIEVIMLLTNRVDLLRILDSIDLDELEIDIPNVKTTFQDLKEKLKI